MTWSVPEQSRTSCQVPVRFTGRSATGMSSIKQAEQPLVEPVREVEFLEAPARSEPARETRNSTASQREAASLSARSHRSPAAMPRSGSTSRKTSSQPSRFNQSRSATASALFSLEWLRKMRDTTTAPKDSAPGKRKDAGGDCHDAARPAIGHSELIACDGVTSSFSVAQRSRCHSPPGAATVRRIAVLMPIRDTDPMPVCGGVRGNGDAGYRVSR